MPSIADIAFRIAPPRPASIAWAVEVAAPSALRSLLAKSVTPPALCARTLAEVMPSRPKALAILVVRSATGMLAVAVLMSSRI